MSDVYYSSTWLDVVNGALARIGKGRLDSLTGGDDLTAYVNTFLGEAVESVLSSRSWSIATRVALVKSATAPVYGYLYAYDLPTDHISSVEVDAGGFEYRPEGTTILSNAEEMNLLYVARPATPPVLPGYLIKAIAAHLAYLLSTPLTSSEAMAARVMREATDALNAAIAADAGRFRPTGSDPWYEDSR